MAQSQYPHHGYDQPPYSQGPPPYPSQQIQAPYSQQQPGYPLYTQPSYNQPPYGSPQVMYSQHTVHPQHDQTLDHAQQSQPPHYLQQQTQPFYPPQPFGQPVHAPAHPPTPHHSTNGYASPSISSTEHRNYDNNAAQNKRQKVVPHSPDSHDFQQPYNAPYHHAYYQQPQAYTQGAPTSGPPVGHVPPSGWNMGEQATAAYTLWAPPVTYSYQSQHDHESDAMRNRIPVSASSVQWKRPKTPPESKEQPKQDGTTTTIAKAAVFSSLAALPSQVRATPATPSLATPSPTTSNATRTTSLPPTAKISHKRKASAVLESVEASVAARVTVAQEAMYLFEDVDEWFPDKDSVNKTFSLGSILWEPGKYLERALPANTELAVELLATSELFMEGKQDVSSYSRETNIEEYYGPIQKTTYWSQMKDDPIFRDLTVDAGTISFSDLFGDYTPPPRPKPITNEVNDLPKLAQVKGTEQYDVGTDALKIDGMTDSAADGSEAMDLCSEASPLDNTTQLTPAKTTTLRAAPEDAMIDDDDDSYSPPPVELPARAGQAEESISHAGHQFDGAVADNIVESIEPSSVAEHHTAKFDPASKAKANEQADAIMVEPRKEAPSEQHSTPLTKLPEAAVIPLVLPAPKISVSTRMFPSSKGFSSPHKLPPKPREYKVDQAQEDILAKLGVTGGPKPVYGVPGPARTAPPPKHRRSRSRSRSRSASPVKQLQNGFASHHLPLVPLVPPPPPPRHARDATPLSDNPWRAALGADGTGDSPRSDTSHRTLAGSDFGPAPVADEDAPLRMADDHMANPPANKCGIEVKTSELKEEALKPSKHASRPSTMCRTPEQKTKPSRPIYISATGARTLDLKSMSRNHASIAPVDVKAPAATPAQPKLTIKLSRRESKQFESAVKPALSPIHEVQEEPSTTRKRRRPNAEDLTKTSVSIGETCQEGAQEQKTQSPARKAQEEQSTSNKRRRPKSEANPTESGSMPKTAHPGVQQVVVLPEVMEKARQPSPERIAIDSMPLKRPRRSSPEQKTTKLESGKTTRPLNLEQSGTKPGPMMERRGSPEPSIAQPVPTTAASQPSSEQATTELEPMKKTDLYAGRLRQRTVKRLTQNGRVR